LSNATISMSSPCGAPLKADDDGVLWLMLHSGSQGMGQAITQHHLALAGAGRPANALASLDAESAVGRAYLADAAWAIAYAEANRLALIEAIREVAWKLFCLEFDSSGLIHCHHNHVRRETHFGQAWWVHRKGALPATAELRGVIPGSWGLPATTSRAAVAIRPSAPARTARGAP
jgi:tRNA-splicing ligase RtcB